MHFKRGHPHAAGTFGEFIDQQLKISSTRPKPIELGCYSKYFKHYYRIFGRDQIEILFFEELISQSHHEMIRLCRKLEISEEFYMDYQFKAHNEDLQISSG